MDDKDLTEDEQKLARAALRVGEAIEQHLTSGKGPMDPDGWWVEDHTTPDTEDDVLMSTFYAPKEGKPLQSGFTLWNGGDSYRVMIEKYTENNPIKS